VAKIIRGHDLRIHGGLEQRHIQIKNGALGDDGRDLLAQPANDLVKGVTVSLHRHDRAKLVL
jgi:hypothetical protein